MCTVSFPSALTIEKRFTRICDWPTLTWPVGFGDTRFTQGSDSASFLAGLGDAVGGMGARCWAGHLQVMCGRPAGLAGSPAGAREGATRGVTGTRTAIRAILGGKERCIAYETIYN